MATFFVTTKHGDEVTIYTGLPARWEYLGQDSDGWHTYDVEVEDELASRLDQALGKNDEVVSYRQTA